MHYEFHHALERAAVGDPVLIVAAHIDDEIIGVGTWLARWPSPVIVHVTDSAPARTGDAERLGFASLDAYAAARRAELTAALDALHATHAELLALDIPDQQAAYQLDTITARLAALVSARRPALVLTHPYEGGHPDHDACAFAVQHAAARTTRGEFTSYHAREGLWTTGTFLQPDPEPVPGTLTPEEARRKRDAFDCFATQRETLARFSTDAEPLRPAPCYNFALPPHDGRLNYEHFDWGLTGQQFRALVRDAAA